MADSDDDVETGPQSVSNYHFVDEADEPISFSVLPIQWSEDENASDNKRKIFLNGTADKGLQKIYKPVIAWRFDLTNVTPEISVLSKEKSWIKLQKPRKSYEEMVRTILITVQCLSYAKRNPEATGKHLWDHLSRVFSSYAVRPSQNDLVDHIDLISEALKRPDFLAKSKFLLAFLEEKPRKRKLIDEDVQATTMSGFIVDDVDDDIMADDAEKYDSDEDTDLFDSCCALCDNGGDLLCCEGRCMRSFHASYEASDCEDCVTLGLTKDEVEAIDYFVCKNCEYKQHQCYVCGKLGSSDKASGAEVFACANATCGHFYHPHCISNLLVGNDEGSAKEFQNSIISGGSFTCPLHKCYVCKLGENKTIKELQFAVCRRCPKAYHRKCLPRKITFEDPEDEDLIARAWEGILPNRILIYCLKHEIDDELRTPSRDHIIFPGVEEKKVAVEGLKKKQASEMPAGKKKVMSVKNNISSKVPFQGRSAMKAPKRFPSAMEQGEATKNNDRLFARSDFSRKVKVKATDASRKSLKENIKSATMEVDRSPIADANKTTLGDMLYDYVTQGTEQTKLGKRDIQDGQLSNAMAVKPAKKRLNTELPSLDAEAERRILSLVSEAESSVTLEEVRKKHKVPLTHAYMSRAGMDKAIIRGKVEASVEAVRTALKKLEEGCSIEDAHAVCEPEIVKQIIRWKDKLNIFLGPFLHTVRYTSYGRHFTKEEKLQPIVDKLHWYVQPGDMIVDFSCGANEFSWLMNKKLEETGKKCSYKNYDIFQAKIDFNFEKRDWMTVKPKELPAGSQLIMGLNPPFGFKSSLANKFINKALEFKPKLLILIVPSDAESLDKKKQPYDLVWEDDQLLSGKSFYLPGSIDENEKQMDQWNLTAPPLYLWSRRDWTAKHKAIASKHGHIPGPKAVASHSGEKHDHILRQHERSPSIEKHGDVTMQQVSNSERNCNETHMLDHPMQDDLWRHGDTSMQEHLPLQINKAEELIEIVTEVHKGSSPKNVSVKTEADKGSTPKNFSVKTVADTGSSPDSKGNGKNQSNSKGSRKRKRGKKTVGKGSEKSPLEEHSGNGSEKSPLDKQSGKGSEKSPLGKQSGKGSEKSPLGKQSGKGNGKSPLDRQSGKGSEKSPLGKQGSEKSPLDKQSGKEIEKSPLDKQSGKWHSGRRQYSPVNRTSGSRDMPRYSSPVNRTSGSRDMPRYSSPVNRTSDSRDMPRHSSPVKRTSDSLDMPRYSSPVNRTSDSHEMPSHIGYGNNDGYHHYRPSMHGTAYGRTGAWSSLTNDVTRGYSLSNPEPYESLTQRYGQMGLLPSTAYGQYPPRVDAPYPGLYDPRATYAGHHYPGPPYAGHHDPRPPYPGHPHPYAPRYPGGWSDSSR